MIARVLLGVATLAAAPARAERVEVPVDVGLGPAAYWITGPVARDQTLHYGAKFSVQAIIDQALIRKERRRIPERYRKMALSMREVRLSPSIFIPDSLYISPKVERTGLFGVTWKPLAAGLPIGGGPVRFSLDAGLVLTAFYLPSDVLPDTFFARPGVDAKAELEIMPTSSFGVSLGWDSAFYVPERLGHFAEAKPFDETIWHVGQAFVKLHVRFPFATTL